MLPLGFAQTLAEGMKVVVGFAGHFGAGFADFGHDGIINSHISLCKMFRCPRMGSTSRAATVMCAVEFNERRIIL